MPSLDGFSIRSGTVPMFALHGELDMATRPLFDEAIATAGASGGPIVLELSNVTFLDSSGINAAVEVARDLPSGCVVLHGVHDSSARTLDLTGVDMLPRVHVIGCAESPDTGPSGAP
jgi:anti-anti-sigma factor